jgi:hypothetical protein
MNAALRLNKSMPQVSGVLIVAGGAILGVFA